MEGAPSDPPGDDARPEDARPAGARLASEPERARLNDLFAELCAIPSPSHRERRVADRVAAELRDLGLDVAEDDAGAATGGGAGNLLAHVPGPAGAPAILLCAHLDTVPHGDVPIDPVVVDEGWENARDAILGADNKAAVATILQAVRHVIDRGGPPVGLDLLFTIAEEDALAGAKAFDTSALRARHGYVFDHATPIGEIVIASPTYYRLAAEFHGQAAHAGIRPEDGRSAIVAAARAITALPHGRLDPETTTNVANIHGGAEGTNIVPDRCRVLAEARSLSDRRVEQVVAEMVDRIQDAANDPGCDVDVDVDVERLFQGYRHDPGAPAIAAAERALRRTGYAPSHIASGGAADANALEVAGVTCVNLANGTERNHEPTERVSVAALEGMLDVTIALIRESAAA